MSTGVETAGLVVATIPLVINALEYFAEGVRTVVKRWSYKRELQSLAWALAAEKALFSATCEKLLSDLVIDDYLFVNFVENPGGSSWKDAQLDRKLRDHLGKDYMLRQGFINEIHSAVQELLWKLEIDDRGKVWA